MPAKPSHQDDDSRYESLQRMSWIEEGGIDLRAARANLVEFVAALYEEAMQALAAQERLDHGTPEAAMAADSEQSR